MLGGRIAVLHDSERKEVGDLFKEKMTEHQMHWHKKENDEGVAGGRGKHVRQLQRKCQERVAF